jgi:AraC-like DNA-binding protein
MPYKVDLFAVFIFLGIVQGVFLSTFFFSKSNRLMKANIFQGLFVLSLTLCIVEIFLMYTGYIVHCLHLVDFSEPFSFVIGPSLLLMVFSITRGSFSRLQYLHFAFPILYLILLIPFYLLPEDVKYNCWINAYELELPRREHEIHLGDPRIFWLTDNHTDLTVISLIIYGVLSLVEVIKTFREKGESFFTTKHPGLSKLRQGVLQVITATILIVLIKVYNSRDTGDHVVAAYVAVVIYLVSFQVMRQSGFFHQTTLTEPQKYRSSGLTEEQQKNMLVRLRQLMQESKPFLAQDFSLPDLARQLGTSVHSLSQVINVGLGKSFFEMTAEYRIKEAKKLLIDHANVKVEEIASQVGYNSKSSFNTAFKKITGFTPSEYRSTAG